MKLTPIIGVKSKIQVTSWYQKNLVLVSKLVSNWIFQEINERNWNKMKLKFDKNKEIFHGVKLSTNGSTMPFIDFSNIKKT